MTTASAKRRKVANQSQINLNTAAMRGEYLRHAQEVIPDWKQLWSPEEAERELGRGFEFKGPGSYLSDTQTLIIIPSHEQGKYWFWVYDDRNPVDAINQLVNSPIRIDTRSI